MQVFAPTAFRWNGVDYPYGWQDLPESTADSLISSGLALPSQPDMQEGYVSMRRNIADNTLPAQEKAAVLGASSAQATAFTSRALVAADNGMVFQTTTSQVVTINTGVTGFNGCVFYGPVTFAGTATLDDKRTTGADTDIAMVQRLVGADSFRIIGGSV